MKECVRYATVLAARPGELSAPEAAALADHLAGCAACQARLADERAVDGLVGEALLAEAARVDFAPFVDQVMARVEPGGLRGALRWLRRHPLVAGLSALAPPLAALGLIVYLSGGGEAGPVAGDLELETEGSGAMVLHTEEGPVVLLGDPGEGS